MIYHDHRPLIYRFPCVVRSPVCRPCIQIKQYFPQKSSCMYNVFFHWPKSSGCAWSVHTGGLCFLLRKVLFHILFFFKHDTYLLFRSFLTLIWDSQGPVHPHMNCWSSYARGQGMITYFPGIGIFLLQNQEGLYMNVSLVLNSPFLFWLTWAVSAIN